LGAAVLLGSEFLGRWFFATNRDNLRWEDFMATQPSEDLHEFHRFGEKVSSGEVSLSPEEVLTEWRILHPQSDSAKADLAAIQEAIDDRENGDAGIPFAKFDRQFRSTHNLLLKS
jgi:hypothetical protein